jgi:hypothetical protein
VQHDVVMSEKCFLHGLLFGLFVYTVQGPRSSAESQVSLSTPLEQTAVESRWVKQTDQIWAVSKEIWSSSYSLCRWMGGIRCGFCMVFMIEVGWT